MIGNVEFGLDHQRSQQDRGGALDGDRPEPEGTQQRARRADGGEAQSRLGWNAVAQAIDGPGPAIGAEGPVEQGVDQGAVVRPLGQNFESHGVLGPGSRRVLAALTGSALKGSLGAVARRFVLSTLQGLKVE